MPQEDFEDQSEFEIIHLKKCKYCHRSELIYMNSKVDFYFHKSHQWNAELEILRVIVLDCGLTEELKWGVPCYTFNNCNIVLLHVFKEYCAILFFKGSLMKDPKNILIQQSKNVQAARQMRFSKVNDIHVQEKILKAYILQAIEIEKAGLKVVFKKPSEFQIAKEFQIKLDRNKALQKAFNALTPGRQRAYFLYFSAPKQSKTRASRVEKYIKHILDGKGLND